MPSLAGANSGIGREIAIIFARNGAKIVLASRNLSRLEETRSLCLQKTSETHVRVDVNPLVYLLSSLSPLARISCTSIQIQFSM